MSTVVRSEGPPLGGATPRVPSAAPDAIALWAALMAFVYLAFCWLAWDRTMLPDEIWALTHAERSWPEQIASIRADLVHPPLFYLLERAWIGIFGFSDFTAKLLPVLINLVAISLFPVLACRITKGWRIASVLFLTIYLHVFSTPNLVRMYGLVLLLTLASMWAWDRWRLRPTGGRLLTWTMIMSFAVMTHYFGALLLATYVLLAWGIAPKPKAIALASIVPALLFCAWVAYVFPIYAAHGLKANLGWVQPSLFLAMTVVPFHFLTTIPSGTNPIHADWWDALPARQLLLAAAMAVHVALVALAFWRKSLARTQRDWLVTLFAIACAPALMLAVASRIVGPAFDSRFLVGALPAYWLLIALLSDLGGRPGAMLLRAVIAPAALLAVILPLSHDLFESPLRQAVTHIVEEYKPGDIVMSDNNGTQAYWELRRAGLTLPWAFVPTMSHYSWLAAPATIPDRAWVFCRGDCNATIRGLLRDHAMVRRHGEFLALFERQ